jgi:hypothetical protein
MSARTATRTRFSGVFPIYGKLDCHLSKHQETSKNLLRVALAPSASRCTHVQLRFSFKTAAARDGSSKLPVASIAPMTFRSC